MAFEDEIREEANAILDEFGVALTIYLNPNYAYNDEGYATITKGTGTETNGLFFTPSGETVTPELSGIDLQLRFRCYLQYSVGTIDEQDIIFFNNNYYKIVSINTNSLGLAITTFYELMIERMQPQNQIS